MAAESRKQIIEQLKNLKLIHEKTVSIDTLSGASLKTLNAILEQVKKNGPKSEKAKQMVKKEAMSTGGKKVAEAVQVQLNDQQVADKLSGLGDIQIQIKSGQFSEEAETLRKQIQGIIKACQQGDEQATRLVKSLDIKKLKGIKDNASLIKQFGKQANDANVHLYRFSKTSKNLFSKCPIGPIKKLGQSFNDTKDDIEKTAWKFSDFKKTIKSIKLEDLKKGLNFTNVSASAITAIKGLDAFYNKINQVTTQIINYHRSTQVLGASNSDLMPGGAKQLDSIRSNMNLTRKETVQFANTVSQLRTTTYSVDDLTKAMQGMKQTLGQVDPSKLKDLAAIMQSIPKDQLDAFTSGAGGEGDTMNAIMAMQKSGQTEKVLQLGASGAFGSQFAQAAGVKINQNQKAYVNNKRAVTTMKQTLQNKTQQTLSNTPVVGRMLASTPFASAAAPLSGIAQTVTSLFGAFSKDKKSEQSASIGQNSQKSGQGTNQPSSGSKTPQKKQQSIKKDQKKTKQTSNKDQLLKSIDTKIGALLKKKFEVSSVDTVKKVEQVKSVGKIKQLQFIKSIKKVDTVYKVNGSGTSAGKGGGAESVVTKTVEKLTQTVKGKIGGSLGQAVKGKSSSGLGQRSASDSSASLLGQRGKKLFDSVLGQRKRNSGSNGSFAQDVGGLVKKIIGSKDGGSEGFDLSSFFNGKISDYLGNGKIQDIIKPQNISNLIKGKFDFKQLSNLKYLKDLKNLKSLTQLKNLKGLLKLRHLKGGKTALKVAGLAHKGYKAYKAARAAHGIGKAALIGGRVALGAGLKGALAASGVGLPIAAILSLVQTAVGGAINAYQDNAAAKNIKEQMGIQQYDYGFMGPIMQFGNALDAVINPIGLFTKNLVKTGSISKGFNVTLSQIGSAWKGVAQTVTWGLYKEAPSSKKQRQLNIAANSQTQYSVQGFKQIYKIKERVNQIKKENMKRNMYMAKQYAGFSKKLDLIKGGAYTLQERLKEQVALTKMQNSFMSGANNSDYGTQSSNMIAASTKALEKDLQELSKMKSSVMRDDKLTDAQRTVELLKIQQAQIQARKKFVDNLKKALDCRNIPSVIQNSFKTMINNARIQSATAGYGGDDDAMFEAMGANIHNAMEDFAATSKFNAQAFSKVKQANAKNLENSMNRLDDLGSSASSNAAMAQVIRKINDPKYKSNLVGNGKWDDGGDIKGSQMGQIADRRLTDKEIQALQASGLAEGLWGDNIGQLKKGTKLSELQLDGSYLQSSKQEGIKKLMQRFESQRQSGDVQGAKATFNILKGLHTALKGRGASTQFLDSSMKTIQQAASSIGNIKSFKDKSGVDYSLSSNQQNMQQAAKQDAKFQKLLSQRGLLDANGNVSNKQQDKQAVRKAYMDRKAQVGMEGSYEQLMKNKDFAKLVKDNGGDKEAAFRQFSSQLQQKSSGLQTKEFKAATSALDNAVKSGQVTDELKNNKGNIEKILQSGMKNAKTKQDKDKIQSGKDALAKLNSGQKLDIQQRKQLLAKLKQANQLVGVLGTSMDAETRAAYQNIIASQAFKNSQVKAVQFFADVFKNQKDSYVKLIKTIQSLQNAIAQSSNVKRAQLKSNLQKSKSALVQFGGGDVGANLASVYKSSVGVSQAKKGAAERALKELDNLAPQMKKMAEQGGNAFNGQIEKMFSGKDKKIGQMSVAKQDGKDVSFIDAFKDIGDLAKKGAKSKDFGEQDDIRKKINERQKQLKQANKKSGETKQQIEQRQNMIKARADLARQMIGTGGTVQGVKMKLQTDINNALAQQITALKNFGSSLKTASNSLTSLQASARKSQMASKQKLLKKKLGSNVQSLDIMQQQSQASQQQYKQKKKMQQTKIKATGQALAKAQERYNADPSQKNAEQLQKARYEHSSAQQGMNAIQTQQYQSANQAVAGALQLVATKAQLAQQSLSIMQDAAQNVAGTTAQWYKLQNEKLSVMAQQVQGIRNVIKSKAFEKLSAQQQAKYKNDLAKKELALAKQRIGAQRTVFEKQLGAIVGGLQSQGAFQGFNNAAVFGIGHGVNQAGMAVQRKNMQGGGHTVKTFGRQSRTQYSNQGNTSMQNAGQNAVKMGTPQASNLTRTKNADGSYSYMDQGTGKMVQVGSSIKRDSDGNAIFERDANGKLVTNDKGQLVAQTDPQVQKKAKQAQVQAEQAGKKVTRPDAIPQDNQTKKQQQQKKEKQKQKDLGKSDHQIYVDILGTVKQILTVLQSGFSITSSKDKGVKTGASTPPASNQNGQQAKDGQQSDSKGIKSQSKASGRTESNAAAAKKQSASGNAATAPSQASAKTPQDEQLQNLLDVRNDQTFSQKSKEQQQQINSRIAQLQAKKNSKSSNGGVASSDKKIAGAGSQSVDQGKVTSQGTLKLFNKDVIQNPLLKASDQQIELQNKNKQIVSHIDQKQKQVASNKQKIAASKALLNDEDALDTTVSSSFDAKKGVLSDLKNLYDKKSQFAKLTSLAVNGGHDKKNQISEDGIYNPHGFNLSSDQLRTIGAKNTAQLADWEQNRNVYRQHDAKIFAQMEDPSKAINKGKLRVYQQALRRKQFYQAIDSFDPKKRQQFYQDSIKSDSENIQARRTQLIDKKIAHAKQVAKSLGYSQSDISSSNIQGTAKGLTFGGQKARIQGQVQKEIDSLSMKNSKNALDIQQSNQLLKGNLSRVNQLKTNQAVKIQNILTGNNKNATVQEKQKAIDFWNENGIKTQASQDIVDDFVRQSVRRGQKLNFDKKMKGQSGIEYQKNTRQNQVASNQMVAMTKQQLNAQNDKKVKAMKQKAGVATETIEKYQGYLDQLQKNPNENKRKIETVKRKIAEAQKVLQQNGTQAQQKQAIGDQQLRRRLQQKGIDTSTLSNYDLQNQKAKILLDQKQKQAQEKASAASDKLAQNPNDEKSKKELQEANANVEKVKKERSDFQANIQRGRQIAVQQTNASNAKKLVQMSNKQIADQMKDAKLVGINKKIQEGSKYQNVKKAMLAQGMTQQQFQQQYGKEGQQTHQQLTNMQLYKQQFKNNQLKGYAEQLAKSQFDNEQDDMAKKAALQGNLVVKETWQKLNQDQKQEYIQQQMPNSQKQIKQASDRQLQRQNKQQFLKQNKDLVQQKKASMLSQDSYDETRKQAVEFYKSKGIDFNGGNKQQQKALMQQFAQRQAQQQVVDNGIDFARQKQNMQSYSREPMDYHVAQYGADYEPYDGNQELIPYQFNAQSTPQAVQQSVITPPSTGQTENTQYSTQTKLNNAGAATKISQQSNQQKITPVTVAQPKQVGITNTTSTNSAPVWKNGFTFDKNIQTQVSPYGLPTIPGDGKLELTGLQKMFWDYFKSIINSPNTQSQLGNSTGLC